MGHRPSSNGRCTRILCPASSSSSLTCSAPASLVMPRTLRLSGKPTQEGAVAPALVSQIFGLDLQKRLPAPFDLRTGWEINVKTVYEFENDSAGTKLSCPDLSVSIIWCLMTPSAESESNLAHNFIRIRDILSIHVHVRNPLDFTKIMQC